MHAFFEKPARIRSDSRRPWFGPVFLDSGTWTERTPCDDRSHELLFTAATAWPVIWLMDLLRYLLGAALIVAVLDLASAGWVRRRLVRMAEAG